MKVLKYESIAVQNMKLPGNWREIKGDDTTERMRPTVKKFGVLQDPLVRYKDYLLVFGAHRVAAAIAEGHEMVQCKLVDCTDLEVEALRRIENGARRHDVGWGRTNYLELVEMLAKEEAKVPPIAQKPTESGREHTPRRRARDKIAEEMGVKSESVRQGERRAKRKREKEAAEKGKEKQIIDTIGIDVTPLFLEQVGTIMASLGEAATLLSRASGILTSLESRKLPMHDARFNRMRDTLGELNSAIRGLAPLALCPFCKGLDELQATCASCATSGYITRDQQRTVPQELWNTDRPVVAFEGKLLPFAQFAAAAAIAGATEDDARDFDPKFIDEPTESVTDEDALREFEEEERRQAEEDAKAAAAAEEEDTRPDEPPPLEEELSI